MRKILLCAMFLFFLISPAWATTYYVRDGGADYGNDSTHCNGSVNVVFTGSNGPNCAIDHPVWVLGAVGDNGQDKAGIWSSGDTLSIDGDSDITPGTQAQYVIGYGMPNSTNGTCSTNFEYSCQVGSVPAGTIGSSTKVIGTGIHKPLLLAENSPYEALSASGNYITLQWLELTDNLACAYNDPSGVSCRYADGLLIGNGTGLIMTDVYVHGFSRYGVVISDYTTSTGSATFTRVWIIGNGFGGLTTGANNAMTGTWTWNQPIIEWNGCAEAYPLIYPKIDNPANYTNCFGQQSNGYGDGLAFGPSGGLSAGNWIINGPGSISFNTQDGVDTLHGAGNGTIQIDKMRFEGNAGQQIKSNSVNFYLTNSLIIGDCGWWWQSSQALSGGMTDGDSCRAGGDAILFNVTNNSVAKFYNNTIISNGNVSLESKDESSTGCNGSTAIHVYNNIVLGGPVWGDDSNFIEGGGDSQNTYIYNDGNDGDGAGTCGNLTWDEDYNIVDGTKNSNQGCVGVHDKCGVSPGFITQIPIGVNAGAISTFYRGQDGATLMSISSSGASNGAGLNGAPYWNNGNDYHNVSRTNPPSMGGLEPSSCAAISYGCFYNSDCCSGSCVNDVCSKNYNSGFFSLI